MLRSAQPSKFFTYPIQNIDIGGLAVLAVSFIKDDLSQEAVNEVFGRE